MKLLIHDLTEKEYKKIFPDVSKDVMIISETQAVHPCIGCFTCWTRTPGYCLIKDGYEAIGDVFSKATSVVLVSRCVYGGYSPYIKAVLDRLVPYSLPYLEIRNNEVHHQLRYDNRISLDVIFYGENITADEKDIAEKLVKANTVNLNGTQCSVAFYDSKLPPKGINL